MNTPLKTILILAVFMGFIVAFDDKSEAFSPTSWLINYGKIVLASIIVLLVFIKSQEWMAKRSSSCAVIEVWGFTKKKTTEGKITRPWNIPVGPLIGMLLTIFSNGLLKFVAITQTRVTATPTQRLGRKFPHGTLFEAAAICATGSVAVMLLALIVNALAPVTMMTQAVVDIARYLGLLSLIPVPNLNGATIYFGSPLMFSSTAVFVLALFVLIPFLSAGWSLLIAALLAIVLCIVHEQFGFIKS